MTPPLRFVALKAFGDLTIAATALERAAKAQTPSLLVGSHLLPLARALDIQIPWTVLPLAESGVPAMYDVRRCGALAAARSMAGVRKALGKAAQDVPPLVFDRVGPREHFLAFPRRPRSLPEAPNIYLAYRALIGMDAKKDAPSASDSRRIGLFPGSRVPAKNLSAALVDAALAACADHGWHPTLYVLDGERPDLQTSERAHVVVPRNFEAMSAAVAACDAVLSADSLPAHLAERAGRPVFVLSPVPNRFWLPLSAYEADRYSLFDDGVDAAAFRRFLDTSASIAMPVLASEAPGRRHNA